MPVVVDVEKNLDKLVFNFGYNREELKSYFDQGMSYMELSNICLHAYFSGKTVAEIAEMRKLYIWTTLRYKLGLTPEAFQQKEFEFKADRIHRITGMALEEVMGYMKLGYASHQVKRAYYLSTHCDKSIPELLAMKTRPVKWGDIAERLGLSREACKE